MRLDQTALSDDPAPLVSPSSLRSSLLSTGTSSQPSGPTEGPLTPSASRVVGDGNGASRPPVAGSAELPGFALYKSVLLIISPFFFNGVLFKSRSRSVTVVTLKGSVSTALGAHRVLEVSWFAGTSWYAVATAQRWAALLVSIGRYLFADTFGVTCARTSGCHQPLDDGRLLYWKGISPTLAQTEYLL